MSTPRPSLEGEATGGSGAPAASEGAGGAQIGRGGADGAWRRSTTSCGLRSGEWVGRERGAAGQLAWHVFATVLYMYGTTALQVGTSTVSIDLHVEGPGKEL